jgi:sec-independent protein translocase protein TatB
VFDIGFWELALISLVALVVVGPERLPRLARTLGLWLGKGRRILSGIKDEIDREIQADEIKKSLEEKMRNSMGETVGDTLDAVQEIKQDSEKMVNEVKDTIDKKKSSPDSEAHDQH